MADQLISIYDALAQLDDIIDQNRMREFELKYLRSTGIMAGTVMERKVWRKRPDRHAKQKRGKYKSANNGGFKGNNKRQKTLPLYDPQRDKEFKIKILCLMQFNGQRCVRPILKNGDYLYPKMVDGKLVYE